MAQIYGRHKSLRRAAGVRAGADAGRMCYIHTHVSLLLLRRRAGPGLRGLRVGNPQELGGSTVTDSRERCTVKIG